MDHAKEQTDNLPLAIIVIVVTVFALSLGDALIKLTSNNFVIWQIFVIRSLIAIPFLVLVMTIVSKPSLQIPSVLGWVLLRSFLLMSMWVSYYISLPYLTLSVAAAAYYTLPIFITLFSALLVGDQITRLGWGATFIGFLGVFLILRPSAGDFNWYVLLPLLSAILYAFAMILTRTKCRDVHPLMLSLALNFCFVSVGFVVAGLISIVPDESRQGFLLAEWVELGISQWTTMFLLALAIIVGSVGAAIAYQNGPSSIVGTFDFAYVAFAVVWGIVIFDEFPDALSLAGMSLIVLAGIISVRQ